MLWEVQIVMSEDLIFEANSGCQHVSITLKKKDLDVLVAVADAYLVEV